MQSTCRRRTWATPQSTLRTAENIGLGRVTGSIEVGKSADFMVLAGDPREDLAVLASPSLVVARGFQFPAE